MKQATREWSGKKVNENGEKEKITDTVTVEVPESIEEAIAVLSAETILEMVEDKMLTAEVNKARVAATRGISEKTLRTRIIEDALSKGLTLDQVREILAQAMS